MVLPTSFHTVSIPFHCRTILSTTILCRANNSLHVGIRMVTTANFHPYTTLTIKSVLNREQFLYIWNRDGTSSQFPSRITQFPPLSISKPSPYKSILNRKNNTAGIKMVLPSKFLPILYGFH